MQGLKIGIVGATGLVGRELLRILEEREFPVASLRPVASDRSAARTVPWWDGALEVERVDPQTLSGLDLLFLCAEAEVSSALVPGLKGRVGLIVDNSSAYRLDPAVPLVIPEINPQAMEGHSGLVANPNCSTVQLLMVLAPLDGAFGVEWVDVATYQSVSGAGKEAWDELLVGIPPSDFPEEKGFSASLSFNLLPRIGLEGEGRYSQEEEKLIRESRRILNRPELAVYPTAVRVPTVRGHAQALTLRTATPVTVEAVGAALARAPGVVVAEGMELLTPRGAAGRDPVCVGRLRVPAGSERILQAWTVADNLRKGAALNAVQIAEVALGLASPITVGSSTGQGG